MGSQDATGGPWPHYYFARGDRAEYGYVCVTPCTKGSNATISITTTEQGRGPSPSPVADGQRRGHWGGLQTYLPNCCTSCHSTLSLFVSMVVRATSPKPFPSPLARVVVAPLQMRNFNVKTPSSLWTFHHAVPSPSSFSTWELSVTENQCQSVRACVGVCVCVTPCAKGFNATVSTTTIPQGRGHGSCFPSHANEAMGFSRKGMWTHIPVPATRTVFQAVTPLSTLWFIVLHATPHKQVSHRSFQPLVNCSQPRE